MSLLDRELTLRYTWYRFGNMINLPNEVTFTLPEIITLREIIELDLCVTTISERKMQFYIYDPGNLLYLKYASSIYYISYGDPMETSPKKWMKKTGRIILEAYTKIPDVTDIEFYTRSDYVYLRAGGKEARIRRKAACKILDAVPLLYTLNKHSVLPAELNKIIVEEFVDGEESHKFDMFLSLLR